MSDLQNLFDMQHKLNEFTREKVNLPLFDEIKDDTSEREKWVLNYIRAMQQELCEAVDETNWKWWKKKSFNEGNLRIELIDVFHFWISACIMLGMDADDVIRIYTEKNKVNLERQETNFAKKQMGIKDDSHVK